MPCHIKKTNGYQSEKFFFKKLWIFNVLPQNLWAKFILLKRTSVFADSLIKKSEILNNLGGSTILRSERNMRGATFDCRFNQIRKYLSIKVLCEFSNLD